MKICKKNILTTKQHIRAQVKQTNKIHFGENYSQAADIKLTDVVHHLQKTQDTPF